MATKFSIVKITPVLLAGSGGLLSAPLAFAQAPPAIAVPHVPPAAVPVVSTPDGTTALHTAAENNDVAQVTRLLRAGANPQALTRIGSFTPLALASKNGNAAVVQVLLRAGANANTPTENGTTPLMLAAASGSVPTVTLLLDHGAQVDAKERIYGQTALLFAAAKNRAGVIRTLVNHGKANPGSSSAVTTLSRQRFDDDGNAIGVGAGTRGGVAPAGTNLPTEAASDEGTAGVAGTPRRGRRAAGANRLRVTDTTEAGMAPPPIAARPTSASGASSAADASGASGFAGGRGAGGGPARTFGGNTALTLAAREGHKEAVRALLESGADVNQPNAGDQTSPLVTAICNGHYDVAKYLLDHGANPNAQSVDGLAALYAVIDTQWAPVGWAPNPLTDQEAITYLDLMRALLQKGANPNAQLVRKLWFRPTHHDESWINAAGATPFWRAAQATDLAALRLLIAHKADPKIATNDGVNALMAAAGLGWNGNYSTQGPDTALATVQYCLSLGLDPVSANAQGYTALAGAAYRGDNPLVELLLSKGARLDTHTARGWSLTDMANGPSLRSSVPVKHPETITLLLKRGAPPLTETNDEEILGVIRRRPAAEPAAATSAAPAAASSDKAMPPAAPPAKEAAPLP